MPNHVTNKVTVLDGGDILDILAVMSSVGKTDNPDAESQFDFNHFIPVPTELLNTMSGSYGNLAERVAHEKQMESNLLKYGYKDWYDFCLGEWGTKWNAYDIFEVDCSIIFNTAWSTPVYVMEKLSNLLPHLKIRVDYADDDIGCNCGYYILQDGCVLADVNMDAETVGEQASKEFACELKYGDPHAYLDWEECDE